MTKLLEALLNHDPILIATAKAQFRKELAYLPNTEWKRRLIELNERRDASGDRCPDCLQPERSQCHHESQRSLTSGKPRNPARGCNIPDMDEHRGIAC